MDTRIERSSNKEHVCPVWTGSTEELRRLAGLVEEMAGSRARVLLSNFDDATAQMLRGIDEDEKEPRNTVLPDMAFEISRPSIRELSKQNIQMNRDTERRNLVTLPCRGAGTG
jgi:hypothetical protein